MSLLSNARLRPTRKKVNPNLRQLISFRLRKEWFALPIDAVERIISMREIHGTSEKTGMGLALYQGQQLLVVDVGHFIFGETKTQTRFVQDQHLLLMQDPQGQRVGIPIDSHPVLRKVALEQMTPLPERYQTAGKIRCVSSSAVQSEQDMLLFILNSEQLFEALQADQISSGDSNLS